MSKFNQVMGEVTQSKSVGRDSRMVTVVTGKSDFAHAEARVVATEPFN
jgi:hypothetical protein